MKAVTHSWWIGAIISTILTLTLTGGPAQDNPGSLVLIGIINGVFWGWIIGLIIDKLKESKKGAVPSPIFKEKTIQNNKLEELKNGVGKEILQKIPESDVRESKNSSISGEVFVRYMQRESVKNLKGVVILLLQIDIDKGIADYRRKNATVLRDPIIGPMKLINFINVSCEEINRNLSKNKKIQELNLENFEQKDIDEIMGFVHRTALEKNLK